MNRMLTVLLVILALLILSNGTAAQSGTAQTGISGEYGSYLGRAYQEAGTVNANHRSPGRVRPLTSREYDQVRDAAIVISETNPAVGENLDLLLRRGFILADDGLQSSVLAETRRDGSSKGWLTPTWIAEHVCFDGNIYLNFEDSDYSFASQEYTSRRSLIAKLNASISGEGSDEAKASAGSKLARAVAAQRKYESKAAVSLQGTLLHEEIHTHQRWGNRRSKETEACDQELGFLRLRLASVESVSESAAIEAKIEDVIQNKIQNAS